MLVVENIILVMSGKGGVGKSTVATQLALGLSEQKYKVGILDIDLCGPSVPHLLGLENRKVHKTTLSEGDYWLPIFTDDTKNLAVMSTAFLLTDHKVPVIWRGPKKDSIIKQFISDMYWYTLDYLIIDTPPGTSDEHITVIQHLKKACPKAFIHSILVTSPQNISLDDVRKQITFCEKMDLNMLGIVENMSGYVCRNCGKCSNIFSTNGGKVLSQIRNVPLLATFPIDPKINTNKNVKSAVKEFPNSKMAIELKKLITEVLSRKSCP